MTDKTADDTFRLLADSPVSFEHSCNIVRSRLPAVSGYLTGLRTPFILNNKGLHLSLPLIRKQNRRFLAILGCTEVGQEEHRIAIWLEDISTNGGRYIRVEADKLEMVPLKVIMLHSGFEDVPAEVHLNKDKSVSMRCLSITTFILLPIFLFLYLCSILSTLYYRPWPEH